MSSPRSRQTRQPSRSRRSTEAGSPSCWSRKVRAVKVNAPIALLEGGADGPAPKAPTAVAHAPAAEGTTKFEPTRAAPQQPLARTRLVGAHERPPGGSGFAPAVMPPGQAKTEFVRPDQTPVDPVAGWVVVVKGPGRGAFRPLFVGMNSVGRDPTQRVCLSFGDETISREEHAFITYDEEQRRFYVQGKANLVRLGKQPVLVPVELKANDLIRLGRTTLRFVPSCGPDFSWGDDIAGA